MRGRLPAVHDPFFGGGTIFELRVVRRDTAFDPSALPTDASIQEIYGALAANEVRTG